MRSHTGKSAVRTHGFFLLACVVSVTGCSRLSSRQVNGDKHQRATSFQPWGETEAKLETATGRIVNVEAQFGLLRAETVGDTVYIKVAQYQIAVTPTEIQVNQQVVKALTPDIRDVDVRIKSDDIEFVVGGERFVHDQ